MSPNVNVNVNPNGKPAAQAAAPKPKTDLGKFGSLLKAGPAAKAAEEATKPHRYGVVHSSFRYARWADVPDLNEDGTQRLDAKGEPAFKRAIVTISEEDYEANGGFIEVTFEMDTIAMGDQYPCTRSVRTGTPEWKILSDSLDTIYGKFSCSMDTAHFAKEAGLPFTLAKMEGIPHLMIEVDGSRSKADGTPFRTPKFIRKYATEAECKAEHDAKYTRGGTAKAAAAPAKDTRWDAALAKGWTEGDFLPEVEGLQARVNAGETIEEVAGDIVIDPALLVRYVKAPGATAAVPDPSEVDEEEELPF